MDKLSDSNPDAVIINLSTDQQLRQLSELRARTREYRNDLRVLSATGRDTGEALGRAFTSAALRGKDLSSTFKSLILTMSERTVRQAATSLGGALARSIGGLAGNLIGNATGNAFAQGRIIPMARGGVVSTPTLFAMAGGQTGLMGEAGAEAVLPLARGPDGRLGVQASGGGRAITINFNVTTPDAGGFRRSEAQIAAMLNRVIERGARNM